MLFLKLLQQIFKALNSEGTPLQVGAGIALGACLGLTPIGNLHNLVIVLLAMLVNVSLAGFTLGWTLFVPVGFLLDPLFDTIGHRLLAAEGLQGLWTSLNNVPVVPFTNFANTVVLGSFVFWVVTFVPLVFLAKWLVATYRERVFERLRKMRVFQALGASKLYQVYRLFQAE